LAITTKDENLLVNWKLIQNNLNKVTKPGRYIGDEYNIRSKDWDLVTLKVALAFPDLYEIGMSHLGLRILYELINAQPGMLAERVFSPWFDFQELLKTLGQPLYALESKRSLHEFDVIGFSLQYELSYTNVLTILDCAGIPVTVAERGEADPLVIGGGPCVFNSEPVADFFDCFFIGEAEEVLVAVMEKIRDCRRSGLSKAQLLRELEPIPGIYVPAHFNITYRADGRIDSITALTDAKPVRAVVRRLTEAFFPQKWLVPSMEIVHDRVAFEIQRGCTRGCRFCQAGMIYRPVREKEPRQIMETLRRLIRDTGYEELSLTSLSSADYSRIEELITEACGCFTPKQVNVSLPSLRIDSFSVDLAEKFQSNRKGSLTFAPEAGTERLRRVINKGVTREDLLTASEAAFRAGWQRIKLYFMIGLPTETDGDLDGIVALSQEVLQLGKRIYPRTNALRITVSVSTFVPKAHTPFQWRQQISVAQIEAKQQYLQERLRGRHLELNWHDPALSRMEGIFARGDRRLGQVIKAAWRQGAQFDSWGDQFRYEVWLRTFEQYGLDPDWYTRSRAYDEILPWSHLNSGVSPEFLRNEDQKAQRAELTGDCRENCTSCGVCPSLGVKPSSAGGQDV
jgi:radical SAM family uncharacterized protein